MPADTRLYLQFEGKVKDGQFDSFKNWVEKQEIYKDNYQETLRLLSKKGFIK